MVSGVVTAGSYTRVVAGAQVVPLLVRGEHRVLHRGVRAARLLAFEPLHAEVGVVVAGQVGVVWGAVVASFPGTPCRLRSRVDTDMTDQRSAVGSGVGAAGVAADEGLLA